MVCPHCGNETKEGAAFCSKCGTQLNTPAAGIGQPAFNAANATAEQQQKCPRKIIVGLLFASPQSLSPL